jgi:hypothetical protein
LYVELFSWKFDVDILPEYIEEKVKSLTLEIVEKVELNRLFSLKPLSFPKTAEREVFQHGFSAL